MGVGVVRFRGNSLRDRESRSKGGARFLVGGRHRRNGQRREERRDGKKRSNF